jgi:hypothetical protein
MGDYAREYMNSNPNTPMPWLAVKTAKYRHFERKFVWNLVCGFIAYGFVNGDFFAWYTDEQTYNFFNEIIHKIFFGTGK